MASKVSKGQRYIGETKNQLRDGYGIYKYPNRFFRYEGDWKEGKKHGHGKLVMADGSYYEGEFIHGEIEGHGYRKWSSGVTYSGQFSDGEMNGHGVMTYSDGTVYEGEFLSNKREGHGILKQSDGAVYEGSFHNDKKHGEGSQKYLNGDLYIGDWIQGARQGSGELRCATSTIYDGQWRNDLYNGEGTMIHCSGVTYEGMWINGRPAVEASQIVVVGDVELDMYQGTSFSLDVEIRSETGQVVRQENGHVLQITAGFRHYTPSQTSPLFDLIEDMEERPLPTPYGYDVVAYPLTEYSYIEEKYNLDGFIPKPSTALTEVTTIEVSIPEEPVHIPQIEVINPVSEPTEESSKVDQVKAAEESTSEEPQTIESATQAGNEPTEPAPATAGEGSVAADQQPPAMAELTDETPVPPAINNQKTENGCTSFKGLVLPGAPLGYRPFNVLDIMMEEEARTKSRNSKTAGLAQQLRLGAKLGKNVVSLRPVPQTTQQSHSDDLPDANMLEKRDPKAYKIKREKMYGDERFARPAEYVIMVNDVTDPPFLDKRLPTSYSLVRIQHPKKSKKAKTPSTKGSKPGSRGSSHD
ncbi:MORN repeat-containing protein 1-like isoform X1 [Asterias rubens]|uniref:MORN repeat-containing protein 1-like isoform X1 n=1 Tax=Asterias rubens TaxID=7604 RepID=UPI001455D175|nr:MORN repeat-containing protein 1-like isoform X1 [Asterias rubens]